jgi:hypothetical protein
LVVKYLDHPPEFYGNKVIDFTICRHAIIFEHLLFGRLHILKGNSFIDDTPDLILKKFV